MIKNILKIISLLAAILIVAGCASIPDSVVFNNKTVNTFSASSGCKALSLDQDCSPLSGATRDIQIVGVSGSEDGKTVFIMSKEKFHP